MRGDAFAITTSARGNTSSQSGKCKKLLAEAGGTNLEAGVEAFSFTFG
jgi:hypothetical protein